MTTEVAMTESELVPGDGVFAPRRVRVTYQCGKCGHVWSRTFKAAPRKDPDCPNRECVAIERTAALERQVANLTRMLAEQRPPAQIGANVNVKAVDTTADIVMTDYGMTNLKDNIRPGEGVAPKLDDPRKQAMADNYFNPKGGSSVLSAPGEPKVTMQANQMNLLGRRAIAGAFRGMAVGPMDVAPAVAKGQPALRMVRTEVVGGGRR